MPPRVPRVPPGGGAGIGITTLISTPPYEILKGMRAIAGAVPYQKGGSADHIS